MGASQSSYDEEYDQNEETNEEMEEMPVKVACLPIDVIYRSVPRCWNASQSISRIKRENRKKTLKKKKKRRSTKSSSCLIPTILYLVSCGEFTGILRRSDSIDNMINHEEVWRMHSYITFRRRRRAWRKR